MRRFDVGGHACEFAVRESYVKSGERKEHVWISCNGHKAIDKDFGDAGVGDIVLAQEFDGERGHVRIAMQWERGTGAGLTVFEIARFDLSHPWTKPEARVIFEHFSATGAETLDSGNLLLANVGRRFLGNQVLPAGTNLYRWNGNRYVFERSFTWKQAAGPESRYCVVAAPNSCPADISQRPLPNPD